MVLSASGVGIGEARRDGRHGVLSRLEDCSPSSQEAAQRSFCPMKKAKNIPLREPTKQSSSSEALQVLNPNAAGIDIGSSAHFVCVGAQAVQSGQNRIRQFGAFTHQLDELVQWVKSCGVTTVVMESTGVYWIALFQKLEQAGLETLLVNARDVRHLPGRKTDLKDCEWLQQLHTYGLLRGAFRPADGICRMRSIMRHRGNLVAAAAQQVQLMQKALQQMNILLHHVVSDLDGETGLRILDAIIAGERDPQNLVKLRDERIKKSTPEEMAAALKGDWRPEHLFVLQQSLEAYRFFQTQLTQCDGHLQETMNQLVAEMGLEISRTPAEPPAEAKSKKKKKNKQAGNAPKVDLSPQLHALAGIDLTQTMGVSVLSSLILISEIGTDMSRWRHEKAFSSWLGLSPNHKISGGKILSNRTRPVVNRAANVLRLIALAVGRTDTVLGHFYRRIRARAGAPKAITATARKLACLIYYLLKHKKPYVEPDLGIYLEKFEKQRVRNLKRQAETLGFQLVPIA
jgi:transposase